MCASSARRCQNQTSSPLLHEFEAIFVDAAREKVVEQTNLCNGSGVPKLMLWSEEEIFDITSPNQNSC